MYPHAVIIGQPLLYQPEGNRYLNLFAQNLIFASQFLVFLHLYSSSVWCSKEDQTQAMKKRDKKAFIKVNFDLEGKLKVLFRYSK